MPAIRVATTIGAGPAEVWRKVERLDDHTSWMADAREIRFLTGRRQGVGATFDCLTVVGPLRTTDRMEITEWEPGRAIGVRHVGLVTGEGRFTLEDAGAGRSLFTWSEQLRFPWWMGGPVGGFVARPVLRAVWARNLRSLRDQVESAAALSGGDAAREAGP